MSPFTRLLGLLLLFVVSTTALSASDAEPAAAVSETQIAELILQLQDRSNGVATVDALMNLADKRVKLVFEAAIARKIALWEERAVYADPVPVPEDAGDDHVQQARLFPVWVQLDADGKPVGEPQQTVAKADLGTFGTSRKVRKALISKLSILGLLLPDPAERLTAAKGLGNKKVSAALAKLQELAASDPDPEVKRMAHESAQLILLNDEEAGSEASLTAARELAAMRSIRAHDLLKERVVAPGLDEAQRAVYRDSLAEVKDHIFVTDWMKNIFSGLSLGTILIMIALGLAITFGLMGVINMAHGEMLMIGAVTTWACFEFIGLALPEAYFDWYYVIAAPLAFIMAGLVGLAAEVLILRHLYKRPLDSMLATIGLSFILIQAVRLWKGDNLGLTTPSIFGGGWEIYQDVVLPYNRLFLMVLTIVAVLSVFALFKFTRIGLMLRATVQNRQMASAVGVNTRMVDMFTFSLGSGLAGIAGFGMVLITNVTPEMGQTYIVQSFLTTVVGGVGKLIGVVISGLGIGTATKVIEPTVLMEEPIKIFDAAWAQVAVLLLVILFITKRPGGLFPDKGRMADQADRLSMPSITKLTRRQEWTLGAVMLFLGLVLVPALYAGGLVDLGFVNRLGYIFAFAICAIGLDLIWGYMGALSLCQFLFFALGGYAMGLHLINHGPMREGGVPECLAYVSSSVEQAGPPWFLSFFHGLSGTLVLGMLIPGALALVIGLLTFRSRVKGVYFAILTQAITVAAKLIFDKIDVGLGGTNGLTKFETIAGYGLAENADFGPLGQTKFWLYIVSFLTLTAVFLAARWYVGSGYGRLLVAIRDDETRLRFNGYRTWVYKVLTFVIAAACAGIGGMLYTPQKTLVNPALMAPIESILVVAWVALGGRGTLWGAVIGAIVVSMLYEELTTLAPDYWLFVLGLLFVLVPLAFPGGLMSLPSVIRKALMKGSAKTPVAKAQEDPA